MGLGIPDALCCASHDQVKELNKLIVYSLKAGYASRSRMA